MVLPGKISFVLIAAWALAALGARDAAAQHISIDGRFSPAQTLAAVGGTYSIGANLGKQVGGNLFQSFGIFGLTTGETAAFSGPATVSNVIGRVTGGTPSSVNGKIQSTITGANLYLINPNGIVFGPNATVNVSGSFHASTADYLKMSDGAKFQATNPDSSTLSAAPPAAFGFLNAQPAAITVNGSTLAPGPAPAGLAPANLGVVGGPISITGGTLRAPAGTIHVAGIAGTGEVPVAPTNTGASTVTSFAPVEITANSLLTASTPLGAAGNGGSVFIRSGALTVDASTIAANNSGSGPGGQLVLQGDNQVTLSNGTSVQASANASNSGQSSVFIGPGALTITASTIAANNSGSGPGSQLVLQGDQGITFSNGAIVQALAAGSGSGPGLTITTAPAGLVRADASTVTLGTIGSGGGGAINVQTGQLTLSNGAAIKSLTQGSGGGSPIAISAGSVLLDGGSTRNPSTGIFSTTAVGPGGGGPISIVAGDLTLQKGANVLAESSGRGAGGGVAVSIGGSLTVDSGASLGTIATSTGNAGDVSVMAAGPVSVDMTVGATSSLLGGIGSVAYGSGNAGNIAVTAGALTLTHNGLVSSLTAPKAGGNSGNVSINVSGMLSIDGSGRVSGFQTGILGSTYSSGHGGDVIVVANSMSIAGSGVIASGTFGSGNGGSVSVNVVGHLTIDGATTPGFFTGISSEANPGSTGSAGPISVNAGSVSLTNFGEISSLTSGPGSAGQINLAAGALSIGSNGAISSATVGAGEGGSVSVAVGGQLAIDGAGGNPGILTGISSQTQGGGGAGSVAVTAGTLSMAQNGVISSNTFARGNGGSVAVTVDGSLTIDASGTNPNLVATGIVANSEAGSSGNAGSVAVSAGALSLVNGGVISSALRPFLNLPPSTGNAGTVSVDVAGPLSISGSGSGIGTETSPGSIGSAGSVAVTAPQITLSDGGEITSATFGSGPGGSVTVDAGSLSVTGGGLITADTFGSGRGGDVAVNVPGFASIDGGSAISAIAERGSTGAAGNLNVAAGSLSTTNGGEIAADVFGAGNGGNISVSVTGALSIDGSSSTVPTGITALAGPGTSGNAGNIIVNAGTLTIRPNGEITTDTFGAGRGGDIAVTVTGALTVDGTSSTEPTGITALTDSSGNAGNIIVTAGSVRLVTNGLISVDTVEGTGNAGSITVKVAGPLSIDGTSEIVETGITSDSGFSTGNAGEVTVSADSLSMINGAYISASTIGAGAGGNVAVSIAGSAVIAGPFGILAEALGPGKAGNVTVDAGTLSILDKGEISSSTSGSGAGGDVTVAVGGPLALSSGGQITAATAGAGNGGTVQVAAQGPLTLTDPGTGIVASATSTASGNAGAVVVNAPEITLVSGAAIVSATAGAGAGGSVAVTTPGILVLDGMGNPDTEIAASATGSQSGPGGSVRVGAASLTLEGGAEIASSTAGRGNGGNVDVSIPGDVSLTGTAGNGAPSSITAAALPGSTGEAGEVVLAAGGMITVSGGAEVTSSTAGAGNGGSVQVAAQGPLTLTDPGSRIAALAMPTAGGNAGSVAVTAPEITLVSGGAIASTTAGTGAGGSVAVTTPGALVLNGIGDPNTEIAASATGARSGPGGDVTVAANSLTVEGGGEIAGSTAGLGNGGNVNVSIAGDVTLVGTAADGASSGITAAALPGSTGQAGQVVLTAGGMITVSGGAEVTSSTAGAGNGGSVVVSAQGPLTLTDPGSRIAALASTTASGNGGSVVVTAPQITLVSGGAITSTTAGTGAGGSVTVTTPGALVLNGMGDPETQIAASATGPQSGSGGDVRVGAGSLLIEGGAEIASSTAGPGSGGNVNIAVASDIVLPDPGPQITARSTGSGDAGSITVSTVRLSLSNGAAISTEALTSTASGGNITLSVGDFLYLIGSEITTSVKGETGNGGNITIDPQFAILNQSDIIAQAIAGHGGNIDITAGTYLASAYSVVSASSQLGVSGTVTINGPLVDLNGTLVVLSSELRNAAALTREACAARGNRSSLVEAGKGGVAHDTDATLPALYIAGRDLGPASHASGSPADSGPVLPRRAELHLAMRCGEQ